MYQREIKRRLGENENLKKENQKLSRALKSCRRKLENNLNTSLLQVRTSAENKEKASAILEKLGTNLSAVVNMLIKQIIITEEISFEIKMGRSVYSAEETVNEMRTKIAFADMD